MRILSDFIVKFMQATLTQNNKKILLYIRLLLMYLKIPPSAGVDRDACWQCTDVHACGPSAKQSSSQAFADRAFRQWPRSE